MYTIVAGNSKEKQFIFVFHITELELKQNSSKEQYQTDLNMTVIIDGPEKMLRIF